MRSSLAIERRLPLLIGAPAHSQAESRRFDPGHALQDFLTRPSAELEAMYYERQGNPTMEVGLN